MESPDLRLAEARRYGYVAADGSVWLHPQLSQPARPVGFVKETPEAALLYFANRYDAFRDKVEDLLEQIATQENQGSYLMKAQHLKGLCLTYDGLGDFALLHRRIAEAEDALTQSIRRNREKNLAAKIEFIRQAEELRESVEWVTSSERVKTLRQNWVTTGPVDKELAEELETRFQAAVQVFFDRRKAFQSDKKALAARAQNRYRELVQQAEQLQNSTAFETTSRQLKQLQQEWREVKGTVNKKIMGELWNRFRGANNHFFERLKQHIDEQRALGQGPPSPDELLARKRRLTERIEALVGAPPQDAVPQAKQLQAEWKQVGTVRGEESDRLWQRFMVACDRIFELSALEYFMRKRPDGGEADSPAARAQARVQALREFLAADEKELALLLDNRDKLSPTPANEAFRQMLTTKIRSFERKIRTKNELIADFSRQAQELA